MKLNKTFAVIVIAVLGLGVVLLTLKGYGEPKSVESQIEDIVMNMTQAEKIGQMVLVDKNAIKLEDVTNNFIGGVLSGGGGNPDINTPENWYEMVEGYKDAALKTRLAIPLLYGVDAVHGNGNVKGAVIFPHNIGLGATGNPELIEEIARVTADEIRATGANWDFAPVLSIPSDLRWGRVYECFSTDKELVVKLGTSYIKGLHSQDILTTPKHFIGEGAEDWDTSKQYKLDQGNITLSYAELSEAYLQPFEEAVKAGSMSVMVSRSSVNGKKISADKYLLTDLLKNKLGFRGFLVSDWGAIDQLPGDNYQDIVTSINAGMDMVMLPGGHEIFIAKLAEVIKNGDIKQARIDDAVTRILRAKISIGLFKRALNSSTLIKEVGSAEHRAVARQAVRESLVLLKNNHALPIKKPKKILIVGRAADDVGMQSGGWTIDWQGGHGDITTGTSILEAFKNEYRDAEIVYDAMADKTQIRKADYGIAVIGEKPYAEGVGDRAQLSLSVEDVRRINSAKKNSYKVVLIILAGRPLIIQKALPDVDAVVMAWLPGTEGAGITDVLSGKYNFSGKLPLAWPKTMEQIEKRDIRDPLYKFGFGLNY